MLPVILSFYAATGAHASENENKPTAGETQTITVNKRNS